MLGYIRYMKRKSGTSPEQRGEPMMFLRNRSSLSITDETDCLDIFFKMFKEVASLSSDLLHQLLKILLSTFRYGIITCVTCIVSYKEPSSTWKKFLDLKKVNSTQWPMFRSAIEYVLTCAFLILHTTVHISIKHFIIKHLSAKNVT